MPKVLLLFVLTVGAAAHAQSLQCSSILSGTSNETVTIRWAQTLANLKSGEEIPGSAIAALDSRVIGRAITKNLHERIERSRKDIEYTNEVPFNWAHDSKIQMVFNPAFLKLIVENGFLNQYQTGASRGPYTPEHRAHLEDLIADQKIGDYSARRNLRAHWIRPKYAMVDLTPDRFLGLRTSLGEWYGDWVAVFKDEIKDRTTWTSNDSLLFGEAMFRDAQKRALIQGTFQSTTIDTSTRGGYIEAQIWGKVDLTDVDYFMVPHGASLAQIAKVKKLGFKVFEYQVQEVAGRSRRVIVGEL